MTVFFTPCWRNRPEPAVGGGLLHVGSALLRLLALVCVVLSLCSPARAAGRGMEFRYRELVPMDLFYVVNASVELQPNPRLQEMVDSGLSIPFQAEFTLSRARWYWLDETVVERNMNFRLSYHALTRQYRLSIGNIHRSFRSFDEALNAMLSLRNWTVLDRSRLAEGETYQAALRFRLDVSQLPKPFQVAALGNHELDLSTGWTHWAVVGAAPDAR